MNLRFGDFSKIFYSKKPILKVNILMAGILISYSTVQLDLTNTSIFCKIPTLSRWQQLNFFLLPKRTPSTTVAVQFSTRQVSLRTFEVLLATFLATSV